MGIYLQAWAAGDGEREQEYWNEKNSTSFLDEIECVWGDVKGTKAECGLLVANCSGINNGFIFTQLVPPIAVLLSRSSREKEGQKVREKEEGRS